MVTVHQLSMSRRLWSGMGSCDVGSVGMGNALVAPVSSAVNCAWACANCARFAVVRALGSALEVVGVEIIRRLGCDLKIGCNDGWSF
jgi:hypothetical protein